MNIVKPEDLEEIVGKDIIQEIDYEIVVKELTDSINIQIKNLFSSFPSKNKKRKRSIEKIFKFSE